MTSARSLVEIDETKLDAIFEKVNQCTLPGAAVGIAVNGRPVYRKGFGLASMELPCMLSPTIRMRIASISKHFTSLAYLLLCDEGKAALDDRIGKYLPELHRACRDVSIRQLMGHLSGLRDAKDIFLQFSGAGHSVSSDDLLSFYRDSVDVNAPPGTAWSYNNGGYLLLTVAIERICGEPLEHVLRHRVFEPVGMNDTLLRRWDTDFVPNSATLHMCRAQGGFDRSYLGIASAGEGGIVSTIDDMLRWLAHMDHPSVGSAETWRTMRTPQRLANDKPTGYSVGLVSDRYRGLDTLAHSGGLMGGNSHMLKVPSLGLDVVVLVNRHDVSSAMLANNIVDACVPSLIGAESSTSLPLTQAVFRSKTTGRVVQLLARESKQFAMVDGYEMPMQPGAQGWWWPESPYSYLRQAVKVIGAPERPTALHFSDFGNIDELAPARLTQPPTSSSAVGTFVSETTNTRAIVSMTDVGLQLQTIGRFGSVINGLECLADHIWRVSPTSVMLPSGIAVFAPDGEMFHFWTSRTRALPFKRSSP